jgi:hypothetical protein
MDLILKTLVNAFAPVIRLESEAALRRVLQEGSLPQQSSLKEFLTEPESREFLGGISRSLFHKLKKADKFNTYHCGEGRCLYSREELISYIKNNKPSA